MTATAEVDADYWPTPDQSTLEKAAMVFVDAAGHVDEGDRAAALAEFLVDPVFNAAVAAIWADRLPTPWAYHQACRAYNARRDEVERLEAQVTAQRDLLDKCAAALNVAISAAAGNPAVTAEELNGCRTVLAMVAR